MCSGWWGYVRSRMTPWARSTGLGTGPPGCSTSISRTSALTRWSWDSSIYILYRLLLLRLQGEARLLGAPDTGPPVEPVERPERFLVRKLRAEFLVSARDIEWLEAAQNYVNLHVRGRVYPLRSTMAAIQERLDPSRFVRVHRSYIVNLDFLAQIESLDTGDARLVLKDGTRVPCSRRYKPALRARGMMDAARLSTG